HCEVPFAESVVITPGTIVGTDGSVSPILSPLDSRVNFAAGVTWQHPSGMLLGIGMNYRFGIGIDERSAVGLQLRLGFHSGIRIFQPPPPVPPAPRRVEAAPAPEPAPAPKPAEQPRAATPPLPA